MCVCVCVCVCECIHIYMSHISSSVYNKSTLSLGNFFFSVPSCLVFHAALDCSKSVLLFLYVATYCSTALLDAVEEARIEVET